jgi:hypothetical protein
VPPGRLEQTTVDPFCVLKPYLDMRLPSSLFSFSDGSIAMKNYVEKISEPQHYQLCVSRSCDLCGKTTNGDDWDKRNYNVNETEISVTVATAVPATNTTSTFVRNASAIAWSRG